MPSTSFVPRTARTVTRVNNSLRVLSYPPLTEWPTVMEPGTVATHGFGRSVHDEATTFRLRNVRNLMRGAWKVKAARTLKIPHHYGAIFIDVIRDGVHIPLGLASMRMVTNLGAAAIVDAFTNTFELETFNYHGIGTGTTTEAPSDSALQTESSAITGSVRPTGTQSQPTAQTYRSVATFTATGSIAASEHGVLSSATIGSGVLLDRAVFSTVNLATSDTIQITYDFNSDSGS